MRITWLVVAFVVLGLCGPAEAKVKVRGYTKKDGTTVQSYIRSSPDGRKANNWSSQGNVNPYTGKKGSRRW